MSAAPTPAPPDRLDSWKEIADYVGRDVRTAIRWERDRGLPVHRVPGGRRGAVFAYRGEIDEWLRRGEAIAERSVAGPDEARRTEADPSTGHRRSGLRVRWLVGASSVVVIVFLATLGARWWRTASPSPAGSARALAKLEYGPREIVARAEDGSTVWRFTPPRPIATVYLGDATTPWYAIADLDGDGRAEAVASVPIQAANPVPGQDLAEDELICFSSTGSVLWKTRFEDDLSFRGGRFGPPWTAGRVVAFRSPAGARIAWSLAHHTWWPSPLVVFDATGRRVSTFVHAGSIRSLRVVEVEGRAVVLAGGVSNAYRAAFLAVLEGEAVRGHGPVPHGSPFECLACDDALPRRYFAFPPSDINEATGLPYNFVSRILSFPPALEVFTREDGNESPRAEMSFRFSMGFDLLDARSADSFAAHEFYERAGKLDHPAARCPWYLHPPPVREWTPGGWRDIAPSTRR